VKCFPIGGCERSKPLEKSSAIAAMTVATDVRDEMIVAATAVVIDPDATIERLATPAPRPQLPLLPKEDKLNVNAQAR
jgi:hypothetical protein